MAETNKISKTIIFSVLTVIAILAGLAIFDLSHDWTDSDKEKHYAADAIYPFKWEYKVCDEIHLDSAGSRTLVMNFNYDTYKCEEMNEHHDCTLWSNKLYTHPKIAYMKGWKDVDRTNLIFMEYDYDSTGRVKRVIRREVLESAVYIERRTIRYDGDRVYQHLTEAFSMTKEKGIEPYSVSTHRFKYKGDKLDSIFIKYKRSSDVLDTAYSCAEDNPSECYTGPNSTMVPSSVVELIYEHLSDPGSDKSLYEKLEYYVGSGKEMEKVIKYCRDEDFSFEIREALPESNYPEK